MTGPRILLFGANGQVGRSLASRLPTLGQVTALVRADADLSRPEAVAQIVRAAAPRLIVNAAAYTAVDRAETEPQLARRINADAVEAIADGARDIGAAVVHFSTDYVYDGAKGKPYVESDETNPLNEYGASKLAGDQALARSGVPHLIFRTTWVYAADGRNFRRAIITRARETGMLRVVDDQIGAPTTAESIADAVTRVLGTMLDGGRDVVDRVAPLSGVYHMSARGETTWYDFARSILEREGIAATIEPVSTEEFGAPAPRPRYSVLDNAKLERSFGVALPGWIEQLDALASS